MGGDTTSSSLGTLFLAMVCYPEVQKRAQAELDKVLNGRLPEHSDYLSSLVKEVYRYAVVCFNHSFLYSKCVLASSRTWAFVFPRHGNKLKSLSGEGLLRVS